MKELGLVLVGLIVTAVLWFSVGIEWTLAHATVQYDGLVYEIKVGDRVCFYPGLSESRN